MKKRISYILTSLLFLQTIFFQVDLPDLVLCFGDDGHVAIEISAEVDCGYDKNGHTVSKHLLQVQNIEEDNCSDLKLDLHFSNADLQKNKNNIPNSNSNLYIPSFLSFDDNSLSTHIIHTSNNKQIINTLHNTILLI